MSVPTGWRVPNTRARQSVMVSATAETPAAPAEREAESQKATETSVHLHSTTSNPEELLHS